VTVVSIFLALGLGILAGTTVLDKGLVRNLKANTRSAERTAAQLAGQVKDLKDFLQLAVPRLVDGKLAHQNVVLVTDDNTEASAVTEARDFLTEANATVVGELHVRSTMSPDSSASGSLGQVLSASGAPSTGNPTEDAARNLADRLAHGPPPSEPTTGKPRTKDLLVGLLSSGFLDFPHASPPNPQDVGGPGQVVVVLAGGTSDPAVPFDDFMVPFVEELVRDATPVAAGEPFDATRSFVGLLRDTAGISSSGALVTVDDLSSVSSFGGVALVLGLKELIRFGQGGDYGLKRAPSIIPKVP
jgi:hypothetical protein